MDLVTLIAACALSVEPKLMQALIFEQSSGEPWSFSMPAEDFARVLPTLKDALHEARTVRLDAGQIRVGLAGLSTDPEKVTAMMFVPCPNVTLAARQIAQLVERCKTTSKADPIYCAIAAYHGSWDRPDIWFANAVRATVEKGNAPNFDMPTDTYFEVNDIASGALSPGRQTAPKAPVRTPDDRERSWSSALFPAKPAKQTITSTDAQNGDHAAEELHSIGAAIQTPTTDKSPADSLFVRRSSETRP